MGDGGRGRRMGFGLEEEILNNGEPGKNEKEENKDAKRR